MISQDLYTKIEKVAMKSLLKNQIMLNAACIVMAVMVVAQAGLNFWLLIVVGFAVVVNLQPKRTKKALKILLEQSSNIQYIEVEFENGQIELDIKLNNEPSEYEIKLPIRMGEEILVQLKEELPHVEFRKQNRFN